MWISNRVSGAYRRSDLFDRRELRSERLAVLVDELWRDEQDAKAEDRDVERHLVDAKIWKSKREIQLSNAELWSPANVLIGPDDRSIEAKLAALEQLRAGIEGAEQEPVPGRCTFPAHDAAEERGQPMAGICRPLAKAFIKAMEEANPGREIGIGKEGPVTRFIAKIMRFITREEPELGAIEMHLRRHPDRSDIR